MTALDNLREVLYKIAAIKTADLYSTIMTNDVHALYSRAMSRRGFISDMGLAIERQLSEAWEKGADESMVLPEDFTDADKAALQAIIDNEKSFLDRLADDVQDTAANKTGWEQFQSRLDIWANRYTDVQNQARTYFGGKIKYRWDLGQTEEHCTTCAALNGLVAYASEWEEVGLHPQSPPNEHLECGGWRCDCSLNSTTERRSYGVMNKLLSIRG
ncbi:conserved hypothetical protein [Gammaproteobacteria bacterium]